MPRHPKLHSIEDGDETLAIHGSVRCQNDVERLTRRYEPLGVRDRSRHDACDGAKQIRPVIPVVDVHKVEAAFKVRLQGPESANGNSDRPRPLTADAWLRSGSLACEPRVSKASMHLEQPELQTAAGRDPSYLPVAVGVVRIAGRAVENDSAVGPHIRDR